MSEELQSCPFCDSPARLEISGFQGDWYRIKCTNWEKPCVCFIDYADEAGKLRLIEKWNNRPIEQFLRQEVHDLSIECIDMGDEDALRAENAKLKAADKILDWLREQDVKINDFAAPCQCQDDTEDEDGLCLIRGERPENFCPHFNFHGSGDCWAEYLLMKSREEALK